MFARTIRIALVGFVSGGLLLVWGGVTEVRAQLRDLGLTAYSGAAIPIGTFADYMDEGPAFGLQVEYPIRQSLELFLNGDIDLMNGRSAFRVPDINLYRYQVGVGSEVLGRGSDGWGLRGRLAAGATTFRSETFYVNDATPRRFKNTYFTGSAGLELVFGRGPIHGYIGSRLQWTPMKEEDTRILRDKSRAQGTFAAGETLAALDTSMSVPVTLGLRIRTS